MIHTALQDIAKTAVWTLRARSEEHLQSRPLFRDDKAIEWMERIPWPEEIDEWYTRHAQTGICVRTQTFDDLVTKHLWAMNDALVVELGCGLSSRYHRIGSKCHLWIDFDLPNVIEARDELDPATDRHHYLAGSLLDESWMAAVQQHQASAHIFVAEGLLMYFEEEEVRGLITRMQQHFPDSVFLFDTQGTKAKQMGEKFTQKVNAPLKWVVANERALQELPLVVLGARSLFESYPERLGIARLLYWLPAMRNINLFVEARLKG